MKAPTSVVIKGFILLVICYRNCGAYEWLQKKSIAFKLQKNDEVDFNCSLSDPTVNVTFWYKPHRSSIFKRRIPDGIYLQQFNQIFRIVKLNRSNDGDYECRAENMSLAVLSIHYATDGLARPVPRITRRTSVEYKQRVVLRCRSFGYVNLTWYKSKLNGTRKDWKELKASTYVRQYNQGRMHKTVTIRDLVIENFDTNDDGVYVCYLTRNYVKWTAYTEEYIKMPDLLKPNISIFPESVITFNPRYSYDVEKFYKVEGFPKPTITWWKIVGSQEELLYNSTTNEYTYDELYFERDYIYFYGLSFPKDNATFKCVATNRMGSVSKSFALNILGAPKIINKSKGIKTVHVYKDSRTKTRLICNIQKGNPGKFVVIWEGQFTQCFEDNCKPNNSYWEEITNKENVYEIITTSTKSTLILLEENVKNYFYQCTVENTFGSAYQQWKVVPVKGSKPLQAVEHHVFVDEMKKAKLSCKVTSQTSTLISWTFNNKPIYVGSRVEIVNTSINNSVYNSLFIDNVNVSDSGTYTCYGHFAGVLVVETITLNVRVLMAPNVSLNNIVQRQDSSFEIDCHASGYPPPEIEWKKDGEVIKFKKSNDISKTDQCEGMIGGIYMKSKADVLVICKADYKEHLGEFSCTARNSLGNKTAKAKVEILAPPVIKPFSEIKPIISQEFTLFCDADGNPKPTVWWTKFDNTTSNFSPFENRSNVLYFASFEKGNSGTYRCYAQNDLNITSEDHKLAFDFVNVSLPIIAPLKADSNKTPMVVGGISFFIILTLIVVVAVILYKRKKAYGGFYILTMPPLTDYIKKLDPHTPITKQTNKLPYDAEWEFPRNRLNFARELGSGAFGKVFLADAMGIVAFDPRGSTKRKSTRRRFGGSVRRNHYVNNNKTAKVAVKTLKEDSGETEYKDLLSELKILIHVGEHKNIVNLLGACTKGRESELWVIIEYCSNGNLLQFLRNRREIYETEWKGVSKDPNNQLTMTDLVIAAYQVARGMEFLASRLCIHRDLATRNILVTDNYVIKIADFGLARDVGEDSQYIKTSTGLLPVKWMAIEAIIQRLFTEKSDVWSFGIVLWELFTLGGTPYPNVPPTEVADLLARGHRMEPPHACPEEISTLMMKCWHADKDCRPTFSELVKILDKIIELHTSSEGGQGYLEVQGELMNDYLSPSEVKTPVMDPFQCNSPLPPVPSPADNESFALLPRDQNAGRDKFRFDKGFGNKGRKDSEIEKMHNDRKPEMPKHSDVNYFPENSPNNHNGGKLIVKEKTIDEHFSEKDRDSSEEKEHHPYYANLHKSYV